jgi:hypothetical protein
MGVQLTYGAVGRIISGATDGTHRLQVAGEPRA